MSAHHTVNDVTQLNPVRVMAIVAPTSIEEVQEAMRRTSGPVSIGGGRFSMGGQTASAGSLQFDMRTLNRIIHFAPHEKTIRVQAGIRWCDIQRFVDPHGLAVKIMQTYANFTVGGSLSVNCHGRYVGLGPLVLSIRSLKIVLADGETLEASRNQRPDLFFGAIGGYGALGVVVEVELDLTHNRRVKLVHKVMPIANYGSFFKDVVRNNPKAVFHNADLYAPHYSTVRAVTWEETDEPATTKERLQAPRASYPLHKYFLWSVSETPFGKERREKFIDPLLYLRRRVHWRNYEAGYDVAELEPPSRAQRTYVLQEYFVPVERLREFIPKMAAVLNRHRVNALNISIRHAMPDHDTALSWAPKESFAFVLYHKQRTRENAKSRVGVWTRELIDAVLAVGGSYYLPYQPHATKEQFHAAYPRAREFFELKQSVDPEFRFTNALWEKYYKAWLAEGKQRNAATMQSEFHHVFGNVELSDAFYRFLQNVFHTAPEDRFHHLIGEACRLHGDEESIYRHVQRELGSIKPFASDLRYALPALVKQKAEMTRQTLQVLVSRQFDGYLEIGSKGRYYRGLAAALQTTGQSYFVDEKPPSFSPVDIMERGQIGKLDGTQVPLNDYAPLPDSIPDSSLDLVACYVGLHHMTADKLGPFLRSVHRVLRPSGAFVVRDHDVRTTEMRALVSLAHTVFNAGLGETWEANLAELRFFASAEAWVSRLDAAGFEDSGHRVLQDNDPTDNTLFCFVRRAAAVPETSVVEKRLAEREEVTL
jgi:FAD/FMN-containing dehydrogenase/SAM-dependent methyltransferase